MINNAQERIHCNQLRAFTIDSSIAESGTRAPALQIEIPLRWGDQVLPLQINIQEQTEKKSPPEEGKEDNHQQTEKETTRRWQVFLTFDLPDDAQTQQTLYAQLIIIDECIVNQVLANSL